MKTFYIMNADGTAQVGSGDFIPDGFIEYTVGSEPQELLSAMALDAKTQVYSTWKQDRQAAINNIVVTYNGISYQGDETSQDRMSRAINGLPDDTTTISWVASDNSIQALTRVDLKAILLLAGTEQTRLWNQGRPQ